MSRKEPELPRLTWLAASARMDKVLPLSGPVAQLGARFHGMEEVIGSIPIRSTNLLSYPLEGTPEKTIDSLLGRYRKGDVQRVRGRPRAARRCARPGDDDVVCTSRCVPWVLSTAGSERERSSSQ